MITILINFMHNESVGRGGHIGLFGPGKQMVLINHDIILTNIGRTNIRAQVHVECDCNVHRWT